MLFKVDFEKAHDSISWGSLEYQMARLGFFEVSGSGGFIFVCISLLCLIW